MAMIANFIKKGFTPLACNKFAGIAWEGQFLKDFWMWNRVVGESGGVKYLHTIKAVDIKEAALRIWRDRWVPLVEVDETLRCRMEDALRSHKGLRACNADFPEGHFLDIEGLSKRDELGEEVLDLIIAAKTRIGSRQGKI